MGGLSDDESPEGCASGGGRKGAYLDLDAELAELAGGELDGDADAGGRRRHLTRAARGRSDANFYFTLFSRLTASFGHHTERRTESEHRRDVRRGSLHLPRHPRRASVGVRRASSPAPSADHARRGRVHIVLGAVVQKSS